MAHGLFVGLTTLDLIYGVPQLPHANQKQAAAQLVMAAGGPATNAAVTFQHLGNGATLLSAIGQHPLTGLIYADLATQQVQAWDLLPQRTDPPPLSSIMVTQQTGERAVVSCNALNFQAVAEHIPPHSLDDVDIVLIDGHQLDVSIAIAQVAQQRGIPVVLDGGSWKPGLEAALPFITYVICSANFFAPGCLTQFDVIQYLNLHTASASIAITYGGDPIQYFYQGQSGSITVPAIKPVDTLGAGDAFHGAFCHWILQTDFVEALRQASLVATLACQSFGTRAWLEIVN